MKLEIVEAKAEDVEVLTQLINKAYEHENQWKTSLRTTKTEVEEFLSNPEILFFKGIKELEILACAVLEIHSEQADFGMLSVWPRLHGQGFGYQMIRFFEDLAKSKNCQFMCCEVASFNTHLMGYYQKMGYQWYGSKPWDNPYLKIDNVTFELYRKLL